MGAVLSDITQGRRVGSVRAGDVVVHEVVYGAGAWMGAHAHAKGNISLVVGGGFDEQSEEGAYGARSLGVVLKRSGVQHATEVGASGMRTVVLELDPQSERKVWEALGTRRGCIFIEGGHAARALGRAWAALRLSASDREVAVARGLTELVAALRQMPRPRIAGERAAAMRGVVERGFAEQVGTSALGARFGLHPTSVTRIFRREHGCGVMDALRTARVSEAANRLSMTDVPLSRVANECGFADQSHMGRQFRRETGLTPGEYRILSRGLDSF